MAIGSKKKYKNLLLKWQPSRKKIIKFQKRKMWPILYLIYAQKEETETLKSVDLEWNESSKFYDLRYCNKRSKRM